MRKVVSKLMANPLGRAVYRPAQALLHFSRRVRHPGTPLDHTITRVSYGQRQFSIEHRRWSDPVIVDECFRELQYNLPAGAQGHLADLRFREIVDSGRRPLIVDCGSNIGASVLWLTARYPEAHIVAIEPAPDNFKLLQRNCSGLDVDLRNAGIGAVDGSAYLSVKDLPACGYQTNLIGEGISIEIISMETILASKQASTFTPFLLKVDIEGAEKSLFRSGHDLLNQFPVILMEPHDRFYPGQETSLEFFRFHADHGREFDMNRTTVASLALRSQLKSDRSTPLTR
jgi:FkbM family methyltransferase